jgi:hypothetical protein
VTWVGGDSRDSIPRFDPPRVKEMSGRSGVISSNGLCIETSKLLVLLLISLWCGALGIILMFVWMPLQVVMSGASPTLTSSGSSTSLFARLKKFDAYPKTADDFRVRTFSGATGMVVPPEPTGVLLELINAH